MPEGRQKMIDDRGYFNQFKAPIFEASCKDHIDTVINHSTPYFGPLLYWLTRCCGAKYALEIGVCKGWTSYFLASGVKDNMTRLGGGGQYFGIDVAEIIVELQEKLRAKGLPVTMLKMDSWDITPESFGDKDPAFKGASKFGIAFIDGWHSEQHLLKEIDLVYPLLVDRGRGYMVIHDTYGWVMDPMQKVMKNPKYKFEFIRFEDNYGLTILRKMDNYVEDPKKTWPQGPQPDIKPKDENGEEK